MYTYAELQVYSYYSFLRGASSPEELVLTAAKLGLRAIALTDYNSVSGIVRAYKTAKKVGIQFIPAVRFEIKGALSILCYPTDRRGYGRVTRLLSIGKQRSPKGECLLFLTDILETLKLKEDNNQIIIIPTPDLIDTKFIKDILNITKYINKNIYISVSINYSGNDYNRLKKIERVARQINIPLIATNNVHLHSISRQPVQDVLSCIRENISIKGAGYHLFGNGERHLKSPQQMSHLFYDWPEMIEQTLKVADRCKFSLDELCYEYPIPSKSRYNSNQDELVHLTWQGANNRYSSKVPKKIKKQLNYELNIIKKLGFSPYFLVVFDIVNFANERGILCQGRGSAANSAVCYCLGITAVDPSRIELLFERFISLNRTEPPDIDIDFESERREEVIQYIYEKYGRNYSGITATIVTFQTKAALRAVGKVMELREETVTNLQKLVWRRSWEKITPKEMKKIGLDPKDNNIRRCFLLAKEICGFPRYFSQHTGGMVITLSRLDEIVPISNASMKNRTVIEWDKNDLNTLGILKIDILGLGMLTCIQNCFKIITRHYGKKISLTDIPPEDPHVYQMLCNADSIGVFQVESRAQMSMLPRLKPRNFYDLVIQVAIVRPGPIQGDMVHPYLRRRDGIEKVEYPSKELQHVLGKTLGVPLFQEQAMKIAIVAAGFQPSEADELRRSLAQFGRSNGVNKFRKRFIMGMLKNKYSKEFSERCFKQIQGFADYGFPESHAASFALLVYISAWLKYHFPAAFACSLLNSQPMGFYAPAQIIRDAKVHGVKVRPVDINFSFWESTLESFVEKKMCIRLGFQNIKGLNLHCIKNLIYFRNKGYSSICDLQLKSGIGKGTLEKLANGDAFNSLGINRRQALWEIKGLDISPPPLFLKIKENLKNFGEESKKLPLLTLSEQVIADYENLKFSLASHPLAIIRKQLKVSNFSYIRDLKIVPTNRLISIAGLVISRQRPVTSNGVMFITIEDETGLANLIVWPSIFEKYRNKILSSSIIFVKGYVQRENNVIHLISKHFWGIKQKSNLANQRDISDPKKIRSISRNFY